MIQDKINAFIEMALNEPNPADALHFFNLAHRAAHPSSYNAQAEKDEKLRFTLAHLQSIEPINLNPEGFRIDQKYFVEADDIGMTEVVTPTSLAVDNLLKESMADRVVPIDMTTFDTSGYEVIYKAQLSVDDLDPDMLGLFTPSELEGLSIIEEIKAGNVDHLIFKDIAPEDLLEHLQKVSAVIDGRRKISSQFTQIIDLLEEREMLLSGNHQTDAT